MSDENLELHYMDFVVPVRVPEERVWSLLVGAFEGGSKYWVRHYRYDDSGLRRVDDGDDSDFDAMRDGAVYYYTHQLPLLGRCLFVKPDEEDNEEYVLNRAALERGLATMAEKHPRHFANFIEKQDDATTSDVFLQLCLFGEVVYG